MKKLISSVIALGLIASASIASAAEMTGRVMTADPATNTIVLENGTVMELIDGLTVEGLEPGTEVVLTYDEKEGKNLVTNIAPAS
ncbi:DUF1344 domain-containing protein [uncultured Kiloniella sp.]|uniref:DUF1344 domain-containing protein n=1 Tax=Kiloniella sp. TaxID=1938587 RepID=UPI002629E2B9|nr:DUF1344 domain-containing protein [uncultured Kiloniella sp.]